MHTTLAGKGPKCRVCTHPERAQIESLLARGSGISAIEPLMRGFFSRRALYRHRAKHMIHAPMPAARPVTFPHAGSTLKKLNWLQREVEHTAALAEYKGDLSMKLKALHELARLLWLEERWKKDPRQTALDFEGIVSPEDEERLKEPLRLPPESEGGESCLDQAIRLSLESTRRHENRE